MASIDYKKETEEVERLRKILSRICSKADSAYLHEYGSGILQSTLAEIEELAKQRKTK